MLMTALAAGAGASAANSIATSGTQSILGYHFGKKSSKYTTAENLEASKALTGFNSTVNKKDYQWQKALDYSYDSNEYYNLAKRYAENSAKWSVEGLRNAGLNPILAATDGNFSGTYGTGSSSSANLGHAGATVSGSGNFSGPNVPSILQGVQSLESAKQSHAQTQTQEALRDPTVSSAYADSMNKIRQGEILSAEADKVAAETDQVKANTAKSLAETFDIKQGNNISSPENLVARLVNGIFSNLSDSWTSRKDAFLDSEAEKAGLLDWHRNSAKDAIQQMHKEDDYEPSEIKLEDGRRHKGSTPREYRQDSDGTWRFHGVPKIE